MSCAYCNASGASCVVFLGSSDETLAVCKGCKRAALSLSFAMLDFASLWKKRVELWLLRRERAERMAALRASIAADGLTLDEACS